jgi:hypothetical protein
MQLRLNPPTAPATPTAPLEESGVANVDHWRFWTDPRNAIVEAGWLARPPPSPSKDTARARTPPLYDVTHLGGTSRPHLRLARRDGAPLGAMALAESEKCAVQAIRLLATRCDDAFDVQFFSPTGHELGSAKMGRAEGDLDFKFLAINGVPEPDTCASWQCEHGALREALAEAALCAKRSKAAKARLAAGLGGPSAGVPRIVHRGAQRPSNLDTLYEETRANVHFWMESGEGAGINAVAVVKGQDCGAITPLRGVPNPHKGVSVHRLLLRESGLAGGFEVLFFHDLMPRQNDGQSTPIGVLELSWVAEGHYEATPKAGEPWIPYALIEALVAKKATGRYDGDAAQRAAQAMLLRADKFACDIVVSEGCYEESNKPGLRVGDRGRARTQALCDHILMAAVELCIWERQFRQFRQKGAF